MSGRCGGSAISLFRGRWKLDKRQNTKINLLSLKNIFSQPFIIETIKPSNQHSANPSRRVSRGWGGSKHKICAAKPATGSTLVVLLNFRTCPYFNLLTLPNTF